MGIEEAGYSMENYSGDLIVFDGPGSSGKTKVMEAALNELEEKGYSCKVVPEFSETEYGESLYEYWQDAEENTHPLVDADPNGLTVAMAQLTDFSILVEDEIIPSLNANDYVLKDRYLPSVEVLEPMIYGNSYDNLEEFEQLIDSFEQILPVHADEVFFIETEFITRVKRAKEEGKKLKSNVDDDFLEVHSRFEKVIEEGDNVNRVNNEGSVSETVDEVMDILSV